MTDPDLRSVLDDASLTKLRGAYSPDFMLAASRGAVRAPFPPAGGFVDWVVDHLYAPATMRPVDRERCLVALLASQSVQESFTLAVHLYWGLMEGMTVAELGEVLALTGAYTGIPHYAVAQMTFRRTLDALRAMLDEGAALDPAAVIGRLRAAFSGR